jgi:hypothetical protein
MKPNNRYGKLWDQMPSDVKWMATDECGLIAGFSDKPILGRVLWRPPHSACAVYGVLEADCLRLTDDWRDTLERRPEL